MNGISNDFQYQLMQEKLEILNNVFSPSSPIKKKDLFFGRIDQIAKIQSTLFENGQHIALYGERGVGKTSMANIANEFFSNIASSKVTCNRNDKFNSLWHQALKNITYTTTNDQNTIGYLPNEKTTTFCLKDLLPNIEDLSSSDIVNVLTRFSDKMLFIFDEYDSITDKEVKSKMADILKSLSDNCSNITIMIVGIGKDVVELIGEHQSLQRCIRQIKMPRMSEDELLQIINNGYSILGLSIDPIVSNKIIEFSVGFPNFTHLLAKYAAESAIFENSNLINLANFNKAVNKSLENSFEDLSNDFHQATMSSKGKSKFEDILFSAAKVVVDEYDCFFVRDIPLAYHNLTKKQIERHNVTYYLKQLCSDDRKKIIEKIGSNTANTKYRLRNPMMKAFIRLRLFNKQEKEKLVKSDALFRPQKSY